MQSSVAAAQRSRGVMRCCMRRIAAVVPQAMCSVLVRWCTVRVSSVHIDDAAERVSEGAIIFRIVEQKRSRIVLVLQHAVEQ